MKRLFITQHMARKESNNKMAGMSSLNTDIFKNGFCQKKQKNSMAICKRCYAIPIEKMYHGVMERYQQNLLLLSKKELDENQLPSIPFSVFRFHAVGELFNDIHYINFQKIAVKNKKTLFTLWTKRPDIVNRNYDKGIKNIIHIYSSPIVNVQSEKPKNFDKVFTVYNTSHIEKHNVKINCQKKCIDCLLCYSKNKVINVNERIK